MTECVQWWGAIGANGYGSTRVDGRTTNAHRHVYAECFGTVPSEHDVHHVCENRACVNPEHLRLLPHGDHAAHHSVARDQAAAMRAVKAQRTHCPHGHVWTPENTVKDRGWRRCRECNARACREYQARRKAQRVPAEN